MAVIPLEKAQPGDLVLCHGSGFVSLAIRIGQRLRTQKRFCYWNHVAVLTDNGSDGWWVVEAGGRGVARNALDGPGRHEYVVVDSGVDEAHRSQVVAFANSEISDPYGWLTIAAIVLDLLTPARLNLRRSGTWICSALAARAVEHGGRLYDDHDPFQVTPAELAQRYEVAC